MDKPTISIIVPVYNVERYLEQCLESLINQTFHSIEIICLDDGSSDASPQLLDAYAEKDNRIRVYHRENAGVSRTRNVGMDLAQGEYILFVDSDDYIALRTCEVLFTLAEKEDADIVVFGGKTFPTLPWADDSFAYRDKVYHSGIDALLYERGSIPLMCNKMYRSSFLRENDLRLNADLTLGEDHAFQFISFPLAKSVAFSGEMLYFYRVRADSAVGATCDNGAKQLNLHFDVVKYALNVWKKRGMLLEHAREGVSWAVSFLFNSAKITYFDDRVRFASALSAFLDELMEGKPLEELGLDDGVGFRLSYLLSPQSGGDLPLVSVFVECADESDEVKEVLDTFEFQDEQSFEMLFFEPKDKNSNYAKSVEDFVLHDNRARVISTRDPQEALSQARGAYAIRTYANVAYDPQALDQLLQLAGEREGRTVLGRCEPYDVAVFADSAGVLGVRDLFDFYEPSVVDQVVHEGAYPASVFGANLLSFSGILTVNKLFNREFLCECARESGCKTWIGLECIALSRARRIVATKRPLATLRCVSLSDGSSVNTKKELDSLNEGFVEAKRCLSEHPKVIAGLDVAAARCILLLVDLVRNPVARRFLVDEARTQGHDTIRCAIASNQLTRDERTACQQLIEDSYDDFIGRRDACVLNGIIMKNEENLLAVGGQAAHINRLNTDIDEFYQSISYRTGRAVTAIPRAAVSFAKRVLNVVRH